MNSYEIRNAFLKYFESKHHKILPSAPLVVKNDPTLMFTNAGMNQFKDIFLGNRPVKYSRIANSQKCLRVSGKHNDLEEVGHDTYHHTMFEMLGNWSFGDYFKQEAIDWAWEFLTDILKIDKERLYVTVFGGDTNEKLERDNDAANIWQQHIQPDRIINGSKKDNFWEMGDQGPCGPCSEIHIDLRPDAEMAKIPGHSLVNMNDPLVIEIWNNVFIQFNRKASGELEWLPAKHVDTGMGFERLCRVVQGKNSNYDIDLFKIIINEIELVTGKTYGINEETDTAIRVVADHLRAISFAIADGQLPSNNKAGYVIRRLLRRAVRYGYTFLQMHQPFIYSLVTSLIRAMGEAFPELQAQHDLIIRVIKEEENSFLHTLETGMKLIDQIIHKTKNEDSQLVSGKVAFELYDTFGFPIDLTELILKENNLTINMEEFEAEMNSQKTRSRAAAVVDTSDWTILSNADNEEFIGYDNYECDVKIIRYRKVKFKEKEFYHLVFNVTPFYAESGGQLGDSGILYSDNEKIEILNTIKENNLIIHISEKLPSSPGKNFKAKIDIEKRQRIQNNHSATHLLHKALRDILGSHVEQKGSLVGPDYLRFDFSHFQKVNIDELKAVELDINRKIRDNLLLEEKRNYPVDEAKKLGAMMLFGEKYGDTVRVVKFGDSIELCGGTHVKATGQLGYFKIISEGAIAAGIRRIEAITGSKTEEYFNEQLHTLDKIRDILGNPVDLVKVLENKLNDYNKLQKQIELIQKENQNNLALSLINKNQKTGDINLICEKVNIDSAQNLKNLALFINNQLTDVCIVLAAEIDGKANLIAVISKNLVEKKNLNASNLIREIAEDIDGSGGGQAFLATAGGKNPNGLDNALIHAKKLIFGA